MEVQKCLSKLSSKSGEVQIEASGGLVKYAESLCKICVEFEQLVEFVGEVLADAQLVESTEERAQRQACLLQTRTESRSSGVVGAARRRGCWTVRHGTTLPQCDDSNKTDFAIRRSHAADGETVEHIPLVVEQEHAEGQQPLRTSLRPAHSRLTQTCMDHLLVCALDGTAADAVAPP